MAAGAPRPDYKLVLTGINQAQQAAIVAELTDILNIDRKTATEATRNVPIVLVGGMNAQQADNLRTHVIRLTRLGAQLTLTADPVGKIKQLRWQALPPVVRRPASVFVCPSCGERFIVQKWQLVHPAPRAQAPAPTAPAAAPAAPAPPPPSAPPAAAPAPEAPPAEAEEILEAEPLEAEPLEAEAIEEGIPADEVEEAEVGPLSEDDALEEVFEAEPLPAEVLEAAAMEEAAPAQPAPAAPAAAPAPAPPKPQPAPTKTQAPQPRPAPAAARTQPPQPRPAQPAAQKPAPAPKPEAKESTGPHYDVSVHKVSESKQEELATLLAERQGIDFEEASNRCKKTVVFICKGVGSAEAEDWVKALKPLGVKPVVKKRE